MAPTAIAQQPAPAPDPRPAGEVTLTDDQLRSFAGAVVDINIVHRELAPRAEAASAEQREAIQQEAQTRMAAAVERHNLDPETFNRIAVAAESDPQLRERITGYAREIAASR